MKAVTCKTIGDIVSIENAYIRLAFDRKRSLNLVSIVDKQRECELIRNPDNSGTLFHIELITDDPRITKSFTASSAKKVDVVEYDNSLILFASELPGMPKFELMVQIILDNDDDDVDGMSYWHITYRLPDGWHVKSITCPVVTGLFIPGDAAPGESVVFPCLGEGYLFENPFPVIDGIPVKSGTGPERLKPGLGKISGISPGYASQQMMLYYNDTTGLYMATHDGEGNVKSFFVGEDDNIIGTPVMSISHMPQRGEGINYETVLGVFAGDWYDGADIYKKWARTQEWSAVLMKDRQQPDWMRKGFAVFQMGNYGLPELELWHSLDEIAEFVNQVSEKAGVPMAGLVFNFEGKGGWTGPIGMFPPREGNEAFANAMKKMADAGNLGFVFIPYGMWYAEIPFSEHFNSMDELYEQASHYAVRNKYDDVRLNSFGGYTWRFANLCPAGDGLFDLTMDIVNKLADLGCKIIQIDNWPLGGPNECYSDKHGHPKGVGRWWTEEYLRITQKLLDESYKRDPDLAITSECITEQFMQVIHLFDQRAGNQEYFGHWAIGAPAGAKLIPLYNYVYNPVVGSYLAAYPECALPETTYWLRSTAMSVCQGVIPASGMYYGNTSTVNSICLAYFEKAARLAVNHLWDYIMYGEMLRAPITNAPTIKIPYFTFNDPNNNEIIYRNNYDYQFVYDKAVQTGAFALDDGREVYMLFNITNEALSIEATVAKTEDTILQKFSDGEEAGSISYKGSEKFILEIAPLEMVTLIYMP